MIWIPPAGSRTPHQGSVACTTGEALISTRSIEQVLLQHTPDLMRIPGVVGVGQGLHKGKPCIVVMVSVLTREIRRKVPDRLEGYRVRIHVTGEFRAGSREV